MPKSARSLTLRALLLAVLTALLLATPLAPSADSAERQRTLIRHTGVQDADTYWLPTLNQPDNWVSPANYRDGQVYIRLEVTEKPSDIVMWPQLCMWRHGSKRWQYETCSPFLMDLTEPGVYYVDAGTPGDWWKKNDVFDWTKPVSVGRIMMKDRVTKTLFLSSRCGTACYSGPEGVDPHVPVGWTAHVIMLTPGRQLDPPASWTSTCPPAWSSACQGGPATPRGTRAGTAPPPAATPVPPRPTAIPAPTATPTPPPVPAPPSSSEVRLSTDATRTTISVTWPPVTNVRYFQSRYRAVGTSRYTWDSPSLDRTRLIGGLDPDTEYEVQVRGRLGASWQPFTTARVTTAGDAAPTTRPPPPAPEGSDTLQPSASADTATITVSWPAVDGARNYQVRYRERGGRNQWLTPSTATTQTIRGLAANKTHDVEVRHLLGSNWQPWVGTSATTGTPAGGGEPDETPNYATTVSLQARSRRLDVTWTAVAGAQNYQVRYRIVGGRATWDPPENDLSESLTGLTSGARYLVEVRAYAGGAWREWASATARPN